MDLEQLEKLNELKEKGLLSAEEFEKEKQKLLNGSGNSSKTEEPANGIADFSHLGIIKGSFSAFLSAFKRWKDVKGRTSRFDFGGASIVFLLFSLIVSCIPLISLNAGLILNSIYGLLGLIVVLPVAIRRLHDINKSGWWLLCPLVPTIFILFKGDKDANRFGPAFTTDEKKATGAILISLIIYVLLNALQVVISLGLENTLSDDSETVETSVVETKKTNNAIENFCLRQAKRQGNTITAKLTAHCKCVKTEMAASFSEEVLEIASRLMETGATKGQAALIQDLSAYDDAVLKKASSAMKYFDVTSIKCAAESGLIDDDDE